MFIDRSQRPQDRLTTAPRGLSITPTDPVLDRDGKDLGRLGVPRAVFERLGAVWGLLDGFQDGLGTISGFFKVNWGGLGAS